MASPRRRSTSSRRQHAIANGYRSGLEESIAADLEARSIPFEFETLKLKYTKPETNHTYTPDFTLPNGVIVESKGRFLPGDRAKHLRVRACNPDIDLRFIFQNPNARLYKGSPTTYAAWADKYGFLWAKKKVPQEWIDEPPR